MQTQLDKTALKTRDRYSSLASPTNATEFATFKIPDVLPKDSVSASNDYIAATPELPENTKSMKGETEQSQISHTNINQAIYLGTQNDSPTKVRKTADMSDVQTVQKSRSDNRSNSLTQS